MACPNDCSGHGTCEFIEELAADTDKRVGGVAGRTYTSWDQEKIVGCKCDPLYEGHDCNSRVCPMGDDPLTTGQADMKQIITTTENAAFFLTYYDPYGESWTTGSITATGTFATSGHQDIVCAAVQTALRRLPNHALSDVTVAHNSGILFSYARTAGVAATNAGAADTGTGTSTAISDNATGGYWVCQVTFPTAAGTTGKQHLFGCNNDVRSTAGYQPIAAGTGSTKVCNVYEYAGLASITTLKLTELATCSSRGTCDSSTGTCACYPGHKGAACEKQEALV